MIARPGRAAFVVVRPTSFCNFNCTYCYIAPENRRRKGWLEPNTVARMIEVLAGLGHAMIGLSWQGGEPTVGGIDRLATLVDAAEGMAASEGATLRHCLHTNGALIDERWARFLAERHISVGVSLDGYQEVNDRNRRFLFPGRKESPYGLAIHALGILETAGVPLEVTATLASPESVDPDRMYEFLRSLPVQRINLEPLLPGTPWRTIEDGAAWLGPYGRLFVVLYEKWRRDTEPRPRIEYFDALERALDGAPCDACHMSGDCWNHLMLQPNGDVYPCDQFGDDSSYRIGNVTDPEIGSALRGLPASELGRQAERLKEACRECSWYRVCRGGCMFQRLSEGSSAFALTGYPDRCGRSLLFSQFTRAREFPPSGVNRHD